MGGVHGPICAIQGAQAADRADAWAGTKGARDDKAAGDMQVADTLSP